MPKPKPNIKKEIKTLTKRNEILKEEIGFIEYDIYCNQKQINKLRGKLHENIIGIRTNRT